MIGVKNVSNLTFYHLLTAASKIVLIDSNKTQFSNFNNATNLLKFYRTAANITS